MLLIRELIHDLESDASYGLEGHRSFNPFVIVFILNYISTNGKTWKGWRTICILLLMTKPHQKLTYYHKFITSSLSWCHMFLWLSWKSQKPQKTISWVQQQEWENEATKIEIRKVMRQFCCHTMKFVAWCETWHILAWKGW